ncbi:MAG: SPOR domain-containing protein [candidate division WOR-3 bacterium]
MPLFLIFAQIVVNSERVIKIDYENLFYEELQLKDEIIDYCLYDNLYVLTGRYIRCIDTTDLKIIDRTPLPQKFNYLTVSSDEIFLISSNEIVKLNRNNLSFRGGIGIEPGDYRPMLSPFLLPDDNRIYLITHSEKKSVIKVFDTSNGKKIGSATFARILDLKYLPEKKIFATMDNSGINLIDLKLKNRKKIKLPFVGDNLFIDRCGYIITNQQGIFYLNNGGRMIDFQPLCLKGEIQNDNLVFLNSDIIGFIDPFTLRIKKAVENKEGIKNIQGIDKYYYLSVNESGELFLVDAIKSEVRRLMKKEKVSALIIKGNRPELDSLFYIQLSAFSDEKRAKIFCESIIMTGLPVFIDSSTDNLYRVKIGGFYSKEEALEISEGIDIPNWIIYHHKIDYEIDSVFKFKDKSFYIHKGIIKKKE